MAVDSVLQDLVDQLPTRDWEDYDKVYGTLKVINTFRRIVLLMNKDLADVTNTVSSTTSSLPSMAELKQLFVSNESFKDELVKYIKNSDLDSDLLATDVIQRIQAQLNTQTSSISGMQNSMNDISGWRNNTNGRLDRAENNITTVSSKTDATADNVTNINNDVTAIKKDITDNIKGFIWSSDVGATTDWNDVWQNGRHRVVAAKGSNCPPTFEFPTSGYCDVYNKDGDVTQIYYASTSEIFWRQSSGSNHTYSSWMQLAQVDAPRVLDSLDFNNIMSPGSYYIHNPGDHKPTSDLGLLKVYRTSYDNLVQEYIIDNNTVKYIRVYYKQAWGAWDSVARTYDIQQAVANKVDKVKDSGWWNCGLTNGWQGGPIMVRRIGDTIYHRGAFHTDAKSQNGYPILYRSPIFYYPSELFWDAETIFQTDNFGQYGRGFSIRTADHAAWASGFVRYDQASNNWALWCWQTSDGGTFSVSDYQLSLLHKDQYAKNNPPGYMDGLKDK